MPKPSKSKKTPPLDAKLARVVNSFTRLSAKERRQFVNALALPVPPMGARTVPAPPSPGIPAGATLALGATQQDYFRKQRNDLPDYKTAPDASITPVRVTYSVRMRYNPIRGLTFEKLVGMLDQWRMGFFRQAGMLWDAIERRDYQLQIVRPKRMKSVARHGYEVLIREDIRDDQKALAQQQKDFLDNFYGNACATTALNPDEEGGFSLLVRQMMDAVGKYYSVHEIVWQPLADGSLTARFIHCPVWWFEGTQGKLRFLQSEFQIYGSEMLPGDWVVTCGDGLMEACSVLYVMKSLVLKSNLAFLDKFGMPGIHGKTDATKDSEEWNTFVTAVEDFANEWSAVTNRAAEISLVEAKGNGDAGFDKALESFDRALTKLWRGGDLGTSSSKNANGASLQEDETEILETDDAKLIEETLESKVTKYALAWRFGPDAPALAYIKLRTTPRRNIQDDIAVDTFLANLRDSQGRGLLSTQATLERYSRPQPKPDEDVLSASSPGGNLPPGDDNEDPNLDPKKGEAKEFGNASALDARSTELVVTAILGEFKTIQDRLAAIARITDAGLQQQKLAAVLADLDALKKNLDHDPAVAGAIYKVLCANLANGMTVQTSRSGDQA